VHRAANRDPAQFADPERSISAVRRTGISPSAPARINAPAWRMARLEGAIAISALPWRGFQIMRSAANQCAGGRVRFRGYLNVPCTVGEHNARIEAFVTIRGAHRRQGALDCPASPHNGGSFVEMNAVRPQRNSVSVHVDVQPSGAGPEMRNERISRVVFVNCEPSIGSGIGQLEQQHPRAALLHFQKSTVPFASR
jgi:hypothetical protein